MGAKTIRSCAGDDLPFMIQVAVVHHAATEWNAMRRLQGRRDIPLSDKGLAELLHWQLPPLIRDWPVYSSTLKRAQQTARHFGVGAIRVDVRLIEMDWGNWEGKTLAELRSSDPVGFAAMERRGCDLRPPDGESPRDVQDRLSGFCLELANLGQSSLLVTHRGVIRAFYALATGWKIFQPVAKA